MRGKQGAIANLDIGTMPEKLVNQGHWLEIPQFHGVNALHDRAANLITTKRGDVA